MKNKKKLIIILSAVVLALAIAALLIFKPFGNKTVNVFPVSQVASTDYSAAASELTGYVRADGFQSVFVSNTQTVNEIYVKPGQHVEAGDALLSYDTTLTDIQLEKAAIEVQKKKLELQKAQKELAWINSLVPSTEVLIEPDNSWLHYDPVETPYLLAGSGTEDDPLYYVIDEKNVFNAEFFSSILPEGQQSLYVVLLIREHTAVNGKIEQSFGFIVHFDENGAFSFRPFEPVIPDEIIDYDVPEEPYYEKHGSEYTKAEIAAMRSEQEAKIRELNLQIQISELEYQKQTKEVSDNVVRATTSGTIKSVTDYETAMKNGEPMIRISAGGGFYVDVMISELSLDTVKAGETVSVSSYESGNVYEGKITKVADTPSQSGDGFYSEGNTNVSYYPATIFLSEDEALKEGEAVSVTISKEAAADNSFVLENMYLLREKGRTYVYVDNQGKLEKREIKTGLNMYGYSTQIKEGLTMEDKIAFPYGKNVKQGAPTRDADISELY